MLVSVVQQNDSVIHMYLYFSINIYVKYIYIIFSYRLFQNVEYSSLCYTVDPCWLLHSGFCKIRVN